MKYEIPEWYRGGQNPWYVPGKFLEVGQGNNAFSLPKKPDRNLLAITPLRVASLEDLKLGTQVAFQDFEPSFAPPPLSTVPASEVPGEQWVECVGLESGILCLDYPVPIYIFDNHNHVFYAWAEALEMGWFEKGATLVHMDEHFDASDPPSIGVDLDNLEDVWRCTNEVLQIATYIKPAIELGIFKECLNYVESGNFDSRIENASEVVLNLDIDVFHEDMSHISWQQKIDVLKYYLPQTKLITIATSPYFIDQDKAIKLTKKVVAELF